MRERSSVHHKRIPMGCDQQGRYPEAFEANDLTPCEQTAIITTVLATVLTLGCILLAHLLTSLFGAKSP